VRPESIKKFDILYLASLAVGVINTLLNMDSIQLQADGMSLSPLTLWVITGLTYAISLLLWYFISRRASTVAKWILVVLTLLGLIGLPAFFAGPIDLNKMLGIVTTVLSVVAVFYLFKPDARAWFAGDEVDDPDTLNQTFD